MSQLQDFSEWSGIDIETLKKDMIHFREINATDYHSRGNEEAFYTESPTYIYDILSSCDGIDDLEYKLEMFLPNITKSLKESKGNILDFGGGTGTFCEWITRNTKLNVTYMDLKGRMSEFAIWRFKKYNLPVDVVYAEISDFSLPKQFDIVYSDAVWEHLPPDIQIKYADKVPQYINPGGIFVLMIDLSGKSITMPMHYDVDIVHVHGTIHKYMDCITGGNEFASVWRKR